MVKDESVAEAPGLPVGVVEGGGLEPPIYNHGQQQCSNGCNEMKNVFICKRLSYPEFYKIYKNSNLHVKMKS